MKKALLIVLAFASIMAMVSCDFEDNPADADKPKSVLMFKTMITTPGLNNLRDKYMYVSSKDAVAFESSKGTSNTYMSTDKLKLYTTASLKKETGYYLRFVLTCNPEAEGNALVNVSVRLLDVSDNLIWESDGADWAPSGVSVNMNNSTLFISYGCQYGLSSQNDGTIDFRAENIEGVTFAISPFVS